MCSPEACVQDPDREEAGAAHPAPPAGGPAGRAPAHTDLSSKGLILHLKLQ